MNKKLTYLALFLITVFVSCTKNEDDLTGSDSGTLRQKANPVAIPQGDPLSVTDLDRTVIGLLESRNDFHWEWVDVKTLWSALQYNNHTLAIGYKPASEGDISNKIHKINVQSGTYREVHDELINYILKSLKDNGHEVAWNQILVEDDPVLPVITVRLTDKATLTALYNLENVRYLEPLDYWPVDNQRTTSSSGCRDRKSVV